MYKDRNLHIYFKVLFKRQFVPLVLIPLNSLRCCFLLVLGFSPSFSFQTTEECLSPTNGKYLSNYNVPPHIITTIAESLSYNDLLIIFFFETSSLCSVVSSLPMFLFKYLYNTPIISVIFLPFFHTHIFNSFKNRHLSCVS